MTPSMWMKLIQYGLPALAIIAVLAWVDNRAYHSGKTAAEKTCTDITVPAARAAVQKVCDSLTEATKEENDALSRDINGLRATYDRLRQQKPVIARCMPLASPSHGDARPHDAAQSSSGLGVHTEWLDRTFYDAATDIARGQSCQRQLARIIYELNGN